MSTSCVTTARLVRGQLDVARKTADPTFQRLQLALAAAHPAKPVRQSDIARALNESAGTITNWTTRGVPFEKALLYQRNWGINAIWLLHNEGDMLIGGKSQAGRHTDATMQKAVELAEFMAQARWDQTKHRDISWQLIRAAAQALELGGNDRKRVMEELQKILNSEEIYAR